MTPDSNPVHPLSVIPGRSCLRLASLAGCAVLFFAAAAGAADSNLMPGPPPGQVETGAPAFVVLAPEALGISIPPTDLHILPDGRVLVVAQHELAFGDGMRWETLRAAEGQEAIYGQAAVDRDGHIYFGVNNGFARVDFGTDGLWRATHVSGLPADARIQGATMTSVQMLGDQWYWFGGSGAIVNWQPGTAPKVAGYCDSIDEIFRLGSGLYVSEQSSGGLFRIGNNPAQLERLHTADYLASETVTCAVPLAPGKMLVGTNFAGLRVFDGSVSRPFGAAGVLTGGFRVNDLCAVGEGVFAAAVDTIGIVFFDAAGQTLQALDHSLDHRLGRVQRLRYARGVLWCLLNEGVARVEFPSQLSHFDPLLPSGLTFAQPLRHAGALWVLADGRALRGDYASGRLQGFVLDSPPGRYLFTLTSVGSELFAATENSIYQREKSGWALVATGIVNARVLGQFGPGDWIYVARGEIGYLRRSESGFVAEHIPMPDLGDSFNAVRDAAGVFWLELGTSRIGRLDPRGDTPAFRIIDARQGLTDGWVEVFLFEGVARFHLPDHLFRYDDASGRMVEDRELQARFPQLLTAGGRPQVDSSGKLWYTANGAPNVLDLAPGGKRVPQRLNVGFAPSTYTIEQGGAVWMFLNRRLVRYDPRLPARADFRSTALITSVEFPTSNRHLFGTGAALAPIEYADNSLFFHYAAPADPFGSPVSFETLLEGAGTQWVSTGNIGLAAYNRLKEGRYVFRVRPVTASGVIGGEARVAFTIRPPWFRTPLAWFLYVLGSVGLIAGAAWLPALLQRRENARLERLVARRTEELNTTNGQLGRQIQETTEKSVALATSEERYRSLNAELEQRVVERTAELSRSNLELQQRESLFRLMFEHAPVGISWKRADLDNVYHFNPTYRRILRLPADTLPDYTVLSRLVHPEDLARHERMNQLVGSGKIDSFNVEVRFLLEAGAIVWGSLSVAVIRDDAGRIVQDIGILEDITARKHAEDQLATTYKNLVDASRVAGMAEVATGVLHNVGNVLNSLNVSSNLISSTLRQSKAESLVRLSALLDEHAANLAVFLTDDPKGKLVPALLAKLAQNSIAERDWLAQEIASVQKNIDHIKEIVAMQQSYATVIGVVETLAPATLFEDAIRMNTAALLRHDVQVVREFSPVPPVAVEKGKVLQILINLIRNAKYACDDAQADFGPREKQIVLRVEPAPGNRVRLVVRDNGIGIAPENLTRIFAHGFTTRAYGHGFGLHSSALAAQEMKGSLLAQSDGLGTGATFILDIPVSPDGAGAVSVSLPAFPEPGNASVGGPATGAA